MNYVQANIQWHNIICDMLIPQRATLFGWAMLFPILILLYRAAEEKSTLYFAAAGVLAGGLPLIHTHSFLALGVMCAGFVILTMRKNAKEAKEFTIPVWGRFLLTAASLFALTYISLRQKSIHRLSKILSYYRRPDCSSFSSWYACLFDYFMGKANRNPLGHVSGIVLVIALPILFTFTFKQASGDNFVRGFFNWNNSNVETMDNYIVFY